MMSDIWSITDETEFVYAMYKQVGEKCEYGNSMEKLNPEERAFFVAQILEMEVNNGGFSQFFFNYSGEYANEIVDAFEKMGASKTAQICKKAVSIYGDTVPLDRAEREELLVDNDEIDAFLDECDNEFYAYEDDLIGIYYEYIMDNKASFSN